MERVEAHCYITPQPLSFAKPTRVLSDTGLPCQGSLPRLSKAPQRLLFGFAASPKSFCTSSARAEPKAAARRRIAAKPAPSVLDAVCCCCCRCRCCCCCFGCCFAVLPALLLAAFRAFDGVSTSLFAHAALPTANCWNAGDPARHAHRPRQGCAGRRVDRAHVADRLPVADRVHGARVHGARGSESARILPRDSTMYFCARCEMRRPSRPDM